MSRAMRCSVQGGHDRCYMSLKNVKIELVEDGDHHHVGGNDDNDCMFPAFLFTLYIALMIVSI